MSELDARMQDARALANKSIAELVSLEDRVAVITGAARGIGLSIARRFAEAGADVVMADMDIEAAEQAIAESPLRYRARLHPFSADVGIPSQIAALANYAFQRAGRLDIWVNNAGIFPLTGPIANADDEALRRTLAINVEGAFAGAREAALRMNAGGTIINMTSTGGLRGQKFMTAYSASKHALVGITRSLALELGQHDIRVIGIAPGLVLTPGVEAHIARLRETGGALQRKPDEAPLGRPCLPDDVARVALFAVSGLAAMMSGAILPVDGGGGA